MYLKVDTEVAGFILGEMGNATKAEFAKFLINKFEQNEIVKEHALHSVALINRIRENRNIIEHAQPHQYRGGYEEQIYKINKRGMIVEFDAPIGTLKALVSKMREVEGYIRFIMFTITTHRDDKDEKLQTAMTEALSSRGKLPLPDKIAPLPPLEDQ